jgi:hypothetical protein
VGCSRGSRGPGVCNGSERRALTRYVHRSTSTFQPIRNHRFGQDDSLSQFNARDISAPDCLVRALPGKIDFFREFVNALVHQITVSGVSFGHDFSLQNGGVLMYCRGMGQAPLLQVGSTAYNQMAASVATGESQTKVIGYSIAAAILLLAPGGWKLAALPVALYASTGGIIGL